MDDRLDHLDFRPSSCEGGSVKQSAAKRQDKVIVRVVVTRTVMEPRTDVDGVEDFYVIDSRTVTEREWVETREKAMQGV